MALASLFGCHSDGSHGQLTDAEAESSGDGASQDAAAVDAAPDSDTQPDSVGKDDAGDSPGDAVVPPASGPRSCGDVPNGRIQVRVRYREATVMEGMACEPEVQARVCHDGTFGAFDGSFTAATCTASGSASCGMIPHGGFATRVRFEDSSVAYGQQCTWEVQTQTCTDGTLGDWTGLFTADQCKVSGPPEPPRACGEVPHGHFQVRVRYRASTVPAGSACEPEVQTALCNDGTLGNFSGSFETETCSASDWASCGDIPHGGVATRMRFKEASVAYGQSCQWEVQTQSCFNGTLGNWSGAFNAEQCTVERPPCGDHVRQEGEVCDDGNTEDGDYCSKDCSRATGFCGDSTKQKNEACDDGNTHTESVCPYGPGTCKACFSDCQEELSLTGPYCGDGVIQSAQEACDDLNAVGSDGCSENCKNLEEGHACRKTEAGSTFCRSCEKPIFVDAARSAAAADGRSWAHAYPQLTSALAEAQLALAGGCTKMEIWIAKGKYKPTSDGDRSKVFELVNHVSLIGGFKGDEATYPEVLSKTVLTGDLLGNDAPNYSDNTTRTDNSWHVIRGQKIDSDTRLYGLTIEGGDDTGKPSEESWREGGGLALWDSTMLVEQCIFSSSYASYGGGGVAVSGGAPVFRQVEIVGNRANPLIGQGGGIVLRSSHARLENVTVWGNSATQGGGIAITGGSSLPAELNNIYLYYNSGYIGGALWIEGWWNGGWITEEHGWHGQVDVVGTNLTIDQNTGGQGGGIQIEDGIALLTNVRLTDNYPEAGGGAVAVRGGEMHLFSTTFHGNQAGTVGNAIRMDGGFLYLHNTLVCDFDVNEPNNMIYDPDVGGGWIMDYATWFETAQRPCGYVTPQADSVYVDNGYSGGLLQDLSDVDNDGSRTELVPVDLLGLPRVVGEEIDQGCYEYQGL